MISKILYNLYKVKLDRFQRLVLYVIRKLEGGNVYSKTIRKIFKDFYNIEIGMYSHGHCFDIGTIDPYTTVGRYCSIARGARILNHNHPINFKSTHPFFFNPVFNYCGKWMAEFNPVHIGNDVWIGANAIIMPEVNYIGDGAVIGGGAIVNKDVPPYAIVLGNPARVIKYRYSPEMIEKVQKSKWWEKSIEELLPEIEEFHKPLEA